MSTNKRKGKVQEEVVTFAFGATWTNEEAVRLQTELLQVMKDQSKPAIIIDATQLKSFDVTLPQFYLSAVSMASQRQQDIKIENLSLEVIECLSRAGLTLSC